MKKNELKSGDCLQFIQKDGNRLIISCHDSGILVKADCPGTLLEITKRESSYLAELKAVDN